MGLTLSKQIENRLATLAMLEVLTGDPSPDINAVLAHVKYFRIQKDVANYIRSMVNEEGRLTVSLQDDWRAMARTQVAAFTADTAIDLVKDTFIQHFQVQLAASISVPPNISANAVADRAKTFTETFINDMIDDVLKKSISAKFYDDLYAPSKPATGEKPQIEPKKSIKLTGSKQDADQLAKELGFPSFADPSPAAS